MAVNPKTLWARYHNGMLEPLEQVDLPENTEVLISMGASHPGETPVHTREVVEIPKWPGTVLGPLTREEIYEDI